MSLCPSISIGTVWIYAIYPPSYSAAEDGYCQKHVYQLALFLINLCWVLVIATTFYRGGLLLLSCWDAATRGRGLSRMANDASYGGTHSLIEQ